MKKQMIIKVAAMALFPFIAICAQADTIVTIKNDSEMPALVKLEGPSSTSVTFTNGETKTLNTPKMGHYYIKARYGTAGSYLYYRVHEFDVETDASSFINNTIKITLQRVVEGNYKAPGEISKKDFDADESEKAPQQTPQLVASTNAIPEHLRTLADKTFAEGKPLFIWDAGGPGPILLNSLIPIGSRKIGYAFVPEAKLDPFVFSVVITVRKGNEVGKRGVVSGGTKAPQHAGVADAVVTAVTISEAGEVKVEGESGAEIVAVPEGTKGKDENVKALSNQIAVPVKTTDNLQMLK